MSFKKYFTKEYYRLREIEKLQNDENKHSSWFDFIAKQYRIVRVQDKSKMLFFEIDYSKKIGSGGFGIIYKAYQIDQKTGKLNKDKPFVVKIPYKNVSPNEEIIDEANILRKFYKTYIQSVDNQTYIFTEYLPGENLYSHKFSLSSMSFISPHKKLNDLNFLQRITLIKDICCWMNNMHHYTPSIGDTIIHRDIKGENIRCKIYFDTKRKSYRSEVYPIDFGLSKTNPGEDNYAILNADNSAGTNVYRPPELINGKFGTKSDIYSLTSVFAIILGVTDPFTEKYMEREINMPLKKFALSGMLKNYNISNILKSIIRKFLNRMQTKRYFNRPNTGEILRFFTTLETLGLWLTKSKDIEDDATYKYSKQEQKEQRDICYAKLVLLAEGLWNKSIGKKELPIFTEKKAPKPRLVETGKEFKTKTFADYDFASNLPVCRSIVDLYKIQLLTPEIIPALINQKTLTINKETVRAIDPFLEKYTCLLNLNLNNSQQKNILTKMSTKEKLKLHNIILKNEKKLIDLSYPKEAVDALEKNLMDLILENLRTYRKNKEDIINIKKEGKEYHANALFGIFKGWGFPVGVKRDAVDLLIKCYKAGPGEHTFFSKKNQQLCKAINNGELAKFAKPFLPYLK